MEVQMFNRTNAQKGFTLIELMIVVVIIGILASLAIPRFMSASTRSKQSEAKQLLKQIYTMQHTYRQGNPANTYGDNGVTIAVGGGANFPEIGVEVSLGTRYAYSIVAGANTFTATAAGNLDDDAAIDTWTINENGVLTNTINDAA
jgi:prepilin-type N-terminal cleavage/methylation domain-containing protein